MLVKMHLKKQKKARRKKFSLTSTMMTVAVVTWTLQEARSAAASHTRMLKLLGRQSPPQDPKNTRQMRSLIGVWEALYQYVYYCQSSHDLLCSIKKRKTNKEHGVDDEWNAMVKK